MALRFATTRWSVVLAARNSDSAEGRAALGTLFETYVDPVYGFIRKWGYGPEDAEDLVHDFFADLQEKNRLAKVDPKIGPFRAWLCTALQHYLCNERKRERALKRGGGSSPISFDALSAEERYRLEPSHDLTPERFYERSWARTVMARVQAALREEYSRDDKRRKLFDMLKGSLTREPSELSYQQIADALECTPNAVKQAAYRLNRRHEELLYEEVSQTVAPEEVEDELRMLLKALED